MKERPMGGVSSVRFRVRLERLTDDLGELRAGGG